MELRLSKLVPIKPTVLRITVEVWDNYVKVGEYDIAQDVQSFVVSNTRDEFKFNIESFQQTITNTIAALQWAGALANQLTGLHWKVVQEGSVDTSGAIANTGVTEKLND
jgi:hypothetical protein